MYVHETDSGMLVLVGAMKWSRTQPQLKCWMCNDQWIQLLHKLHKESGRLPARSGGWSPLAGGPLVGGHVLAWYDI